MTRFAVIGTGAIGGLYGAKLANAGFNVSFLGRSDVATLQRDGLRVDSVDGDIVLDEVVAVTDPHAIGPVDVVLVTIKTTGQRALAQLLGPLVHDGTIVVLMQNGFGLEDKIAAVVPHATVLGGMCFVCANRIAPGHINHVDYGRVTLGQHSGDGVPAGLTPAVRLVVDAFTQAGIEVAPRDDLLAARWQKLVWNMPFNGLSVVLDAGTDELVGNAQTLSLVRSMMGEVEAIAAAHGHPIGEGFVDKMIANTFDMTPYATSMKLDFDAGRPLELDAMYDAPLAVAASLGVDAPHLETLASQLHFLSHRHATGSAGPSSSQ